MRPQNLYLTPEGYEKLRKELKNLKTVQRRKLSKEIGQAIAGGDISENAEYHTAKEAQGLNEKKIAELEDKLSRVQISDGENIPKDEVHIGTAFSVTMIYILPRERTNLPLSFIKGVEGLNIS
jgi:transcription elongation factor GreA